MTDLRNAGTSETLKRVLFDEESIIVNTHPSWAAFALPLMADGLLFLAGLGLLVSGTQMDFGGGIAILAGVLLLVAGAVVFGLIYLARKQTRYIVTDHRVMKITGLMNKVTNTVWLEDIRGLKTEMSPLQRLSGHGTVKVATKNFSGRSVAAIERLPLVNVGSGLAFGYVPDTYGVLNAIQTEIRKHEESASG